VVLFHKCNPQLNHAIFRDAKIIGFTAVTVRGVPLSGAAVNLGHCRKGQGRGRFSRRENIAAIGKSLPAFYLSFSFIPFQSMCLSGQPASFAKASRPATANAHIFATRKYSRHRKAFLAFYLRGPVTLICDLICFPMLLAWLFSLYAFPQMKHMVWGVWHNEIFDFCFDVAL
jgi:hypothetical protein